MIVWPRLLLAAAGLTGFVWLVSFASGGAADRSLLLSLNPDSAPAWLDQSVVWITDLSFYLFGVAFVAWEVVYLARRFLHVPLAPSMWITRATGVALAVYLWIQVEPMAGLLALVTFPLLAETFRRWNGETLERAHFLFWITLVVLAIVALADVVIAEAAPYRDRPFSSPNDAWNSALRVIVGEKVKYGNSYVSGHALYFCALVTPTLWLVRRRSVQAVVLIWALVHAATRIYVAAHFPSCVLMGCVLGFGLGSLVAWSFVPRYARMAAAAPEPPSLRAVLFGVSPV